MVFRHTGSVRTWKVPMMMIKKLMYILTLRPKQGAWAPNISLFSRRSYSFFCIVFRGWTLRRGFSQCLAKQFLRLISSGLDWLQDIGYAWGAESGEIASLQLMFTVNIVRGRWPSMITALIIAMACASQVIVHLKWRKCKDLWFYNGKNGNSTLLVASTAAFVPFPWARTKKVPCTSSL